MSSTAKYLVQFSVFILALAGGLFAWNTLAPATRTHSYSWILLGFVALTYLLSHFYIMGSEDKKPAVFIRRFMASTTLRLLLFITLLFGYAFLNPGQAVVFISHFLAFYVLFTIFEVATLYRQVRKK